MAGLLLSFYGDDFTGSTDAMEALALAGLRTALFLDAPSEAQLARFPGLQAIGVAGVSRSLAPDAMTRELTPVFAGLRELQTPLVHYKICSTFDSSPEIGSIGRAMEVGQDVFGRAPIPLLVGAPVLGRYQAFGNLFARSGGDSDVYRLDRHPTMRQHPVTPMRESDLRLHLAQQTAQSIALFDVLQLDLPFAEAARRYARMLQSEPGVVLFDALTDAHLSMIGRLLWQETGQGRTQFVVGSSGVEYALAAHWQEAGTLPPAPPRPVLQPSAAPILIISGSCSPVTARQITYAVEQGFAEIALEPLMLVEHACAKDAATLAASAAQQVQTAFASGQSVILHTSRGPDDPRVASLAAVMQSPEARQQAVQQLARELGRLLRELLQTLPRTRVVVAGGDTSGYVAREIGIEALEMLAPVAPGSPLCRAFSSNPRINGLEILFKGGQVGKDNLFETILKGQK